MKRSGLILTALLALTFDLPAAAQTSRVTVTVKGVNSSDGNVLGNLCDDPKGQFPGACLTHMAMAKAEEGETTLIVDGVVDGTYALQAFHDADGTFQPSFPGEGSAFSNDPGWPATFANSSFVVKGDTSITVTMKYQAASAR